MQEDTLEHLDNNPIHEPSVPYTGSKKIETINSFEEMEMDQLSWYASLTPEELFGHLKKLVMAAFGIKDESHLSPPSRKIKFE